MRKACRHTGYIYITNSDMTLLIIGFFDGANFGIIRKGVTHAASDFNFQILAEVICSVPSSSGYLVKLTPQGEDNATRYAFLLDNKCIISTRFLQRKVVTLKHLEFSIYYYWKLSQILSLY